ncbi:BRCA2 and CDKN1A-interacting protein-like [Oppia nitens]|uniref:BRCA2 and CDKN1A-interacting protein-like n=1 Tax=Oppia nitens TaxID=1686743 RepID=UPI0023DC87C9|nr:BRCA2 and CDKN1A-interacting protein-like [Oppia nitens]
MTMSSPTKNKRKQEVQEVTNEDKKRKEDDDNSDDDVVEDEDIVDEEVDDESEDSEEDSDDSEDNEFIDKEVEIEFASYPVIEDDFNGIKCLLAQLWLKEKINISDLTQFLVDQKTICSVIKQEADDDDEDEDKDKEKDNDDEEEEDLDVYGVTSLIPLTSSTDKECIKQIRNTLLSHSPKDNEIHKLLANESSKVGLIVSERFTNLPPKISLPTFESLMNDLKTTTDNQTKDKLDIDWYLMVCKVLKLKSKSKNKTSDSSASGDVIYMNAEEELFDEISDHSLEYSVANQCDSDVFDWKDEDNLYEPFRKVLLLSADNWINAINRLKEEFK